MTDDGQPGTARRDEWSDRIAGVIVGTAVGDALGLPFEGMSPARVAKMLGSGSLRHRLVFGRGMVSDDTEHACMTAQALLCSPDDPDRFARSLAWRLRWWLVGLPAGVGLATLRATLKLWIGFSPHRSGVWSAGNGPAMRAAILGACLGNDLKVLTGYVRASSRLTHTDPRAERGAMLLALATRWVITRSGSEDFGAEHFLESCQATLPHLDGELTRYLHAVAKNLRRDATPADFARAVGLERGVTGYIYHTVAACVYCWLRSPSDFRTAVEAVIRLGGDTDSTGAIVGALCGAGVGLRGIPADWLDGICEWPRSVRWMRRLSSRLAESFTRGDSSERPKPLPLVWPAVVPRNMLFLCVVLAHGFRRLLPPYG